MKARIPVRDYLKYNALTSNLALNSVLIQHKVPRLIHQLVLLFLAGDLSLLFVGGDLPDAFHRRIGATGRLDVDFHSAAHVNGLEFAGHLVMSRLLNCRMHFVRFQNCWNPLVVYRVERFEMHVIAFNWLARLEGPVNPCELDRAGVQSLIRGLFLVLKARVHRTHVFPRSIVP